MLLILMAAVSLPAAVADPTVDPIVDPIVELLRTPGGGIQPQVELRDGTLHLVYFAGEPEKGDLFYVRSTDFGKTFSKPIRVNSVQGSSIAIGNIRGAQLAVGRGGRVHVAWNGSAAAQPRGPAGESPMLYARLNDAGSAFEPERNVIAAAQGIDGGGSLAADDSGRVFVFWHAPLPGLKGEQNRRVWVTRSDDDGATFQKERVAFDSPVGACGCCGLKAWADPAGTIQVLFRSADQVVNRDIWLLSSKDHGATFSGKPVSHWNIGACVMSSEAFAAGPEGNLAAWETEKQVWFGRIDAATGGVPGSIAAPGTPRNRKYPALAVNRNGETLLAWAEGTAWKRGGSVEWRVFDKTGSAMTDANGTAEGFPVWSLVAAFARPDGSFVIVY
jgi:hypothetical protein